MKLFLMKLKICMYKHTPSYETKMKAQNTFDYNDNPCGPTTTRKQNEHKTTYDLGNHLPENVQGKGSDASSDLAEEFIRGMTNLEASTTTPDETDL